MTRHQLLLAADIAAKLATALLLLTAVAFPDLPQFEGKAFGSRAVAYPLATLIIPAAWWIRYRSHPFPVLADLLWTLPFFIDTAGNALDLYDTVGWWDDANHFFNWMLLSGAFAALVRSKIDSGWVLAGLCIGFGATTAIIWELLEYVTFIRNSPELATAYEDTLGDLGLGLSGSVVTGLSAMWLNRRG
ncbi:MAG: hypothetical protein ABI577_15930 [bacterium]